MYDPQSELAKVIGILRYLNMQLAYGISDPARLQTSLAEAREIVSRLEQELRQMAEQARENI